MNLHTYKYSFNFTKQNLCNVTIKTMVNDSIFINFVDKNAVGTIDSDRLQTRDGGEANGARKIDLRKNHVVYGEDDVVIGIKHLRNYVTCL